MHDYALDDGPDAFFMMTFSFLDTGISAAAISSFYCKTCRPMAADFFIRYDYFTITTMLSRFSR